VSIAAVQLAKRRGATALAVASAAKASLARSVPTAILRDIDLIGEIGRESVVR
jgi:NADPH:quinone reductase-like Zn-dependent oxidoreductase